MNHFNNSKQSGRRNRKSSRLGGAGGGGISSAGGGAVSTMIYEPWMPVFPASVTKRLRYSTTFAGSSMTGAITSTYVFRANDLFDPDFTSTGHQPMGFDQLMTWYNHFTVRMAKIRIVCKNANSNAPTVCLRIDGDSTPITVIDRIVELGACVTQDLEAKGSYGANKELSILADIAKLQGVNKSTITADVNLRGSVSASPVEVTYFHITMWDTAGSTGAMEVDVILEQEATFYEPRDLTQSFSSKSTLKNLPKPILKISDDEKFEVVHNCKCAHS